MLWDYFLFIKNNFYNIDSVGLDIKKEETKLNMIPLYIQKPSTPVIIF